MTSLCGDSDVASTMCPHPFVQPWELLLQLPCRNFGCFSVLQKYHKIWRCCFWMWCPKAIALHTEIYVWPSWCTLLWWPRKEAHSSLGKEESHSINSQKLQTFNWLELSLISSVMWNCNLSFDLSLQQHLICHKFQIWNGLYIPLLIFSPVLGFCSFTWTSCSCCPVLGSNFPQLIYRCQILAV